MRIEQRSGKYDENKAVTSLNCEIFRIQIKKKEKVGFTSLFPRFAGSDVLIQCMSTTTHSLSNQTFYWSNVAL